MTIDTRVFARRSITRLMVNRELQLRSLNETRVVTFRMKFFISNVVRDPNNTIAVRNLRSLSKLRSPCEQRDNRSIPRNSLKSRDFNDATGAERVA